MGGEYLEPETGLQMRGPRYDIRCQRQTTTQHGAAGRRRHTRRWPTPNPVIPCARVMPSCSAEAWPDCLPPRTRGPLFPGHRGRAGRGACRAGTPQRRAPGPAHPRPAGFRRNDSRAFLPGLTEELLAAGALTFDCGSAVRWFHHGRVEESHARRRAAAGAEPALPGVARPAAACGAAQRRVRRGRRNRTVAARRRAPRARCPRASSRWLRRGRGLPGRSRRRDRGPRQPCPEVARRHGIPTGARGDGRDRPGLRDPHLPASVPGRPGLADADRLCARRPTARAWASCRRSRATAGSSR